jgi:hypothetical protein
MSTLVIPAGKTFLVTKLVFSGPCNAKILIQVYNISIIQHNYNNITHIIHMEDVAAATPILTPYQPKLFVHPMKKSSFFINISINVLLITTLEMLAEQ